MPYQFFFSHSHLDWKTDTYLRSFFQELKEEVGRGYPPEEVAFRDTQDISLAEPWRPALVAGLNTSRVLVCAITDNWLKSEYCGKEVEIFLRRSVRFSPDTPREQMACILPVFWEKKMKLPAALAEFQWTHESLSAEYLLQGLRYLRKMKRQQYKQSLHAFAEKIRTLAVGTALPPLEPFPPLSQVHSALHPKPAPAPSSPGVAPSPASDPAPTPPVKGGPNSVKFIFVAATPQEMEELWKNKERVEAVYGPKGGRSWKPYVPEEPRSIGLLAQDAASAQELHFDYLPLPERLSELKDAIRRADEDNEPVVIIVDVWSTFIERYKRELRHCDGLQQRNLSVVIPWNDGTPETQARRQELLDMLQEVFKAKTVMPDPVYFNTEIRSPAVLKRQLKRILTSLKANVIEYGNVKKRIESRALPVPILSGPNGGQTR
ncbi:MAG TPA: FxsC protein [Myxococcaceae bacterium]|jgi:FxsC-like protein